MARWPLTSKAMVDTLGDNWLRHGFYCASGPVVGLSRLSIYWLPKWSIMRRFTTPPRPPSLSLWVAPPFSTHLQQWSSIWFIRERTEAGPRHFCCLFKVYRRSRKLLGDWTSRDRGHGQRYGEKSERREDKDGAHARGVSSCNERLVLSSYLGRRNI